MKFYRSVQNFNYSHHCMHQNWARALCHNNFTNILFIDDHFLTAVVKNGHLSIGYHVHTQMTESLTCVLKINNHKLFSFSKLNNMVIINRESRRWLITWQKAKNSMFISITHQMSFLHQHYDTSYIAMKQDLAWVFSQLLYVKWCVSYRVFAWQWQILFA